MASYAEYHGRVLPKFLVDEIVKADGPVAHVGTLHSVTTNVNVHLPDGSTKKGMVNKVYRITRTRSNGVRYRTYYVSGVLRNNPHTPFHKSVAKDEAEAIANNLGIKIEVKRAPAKVQVKSSASHFQWRLPF